MFRYCWDRVTRLAGQRPWHMVIYALLEIVDALVIICTLGFWGTKFSLGYLFYISSKESRARVAREEKRTSVE